MGSSEVRQQMVGRARDTTKAAHKGGSHVHQLSLQQKQGALL